jgi:hypothetical protein
MIVQQHWWAAVASWWFITLGRADGASCAAVLLVADCSVQASNRELLMQRILAV